MNEPEGVEMKDQSVLTFYLMIFDHICDVPLSPHTPITKMKCSTDMRNPQIGSLNGSDMCGTPASNDITR